MSSLSCGRKLVGYVIGTLRGGPILASGALGS